MDRTVCVTNEHNKEQRRWEIVCLADVTEEKHFMRCSLFLLTLLRLFRSARWILAIVFRCCYRYGPGIES